MQMMEVIFNKRNGTNQKNDDYKGCTTCTKVSSTEGNEWQIFWLPFSEFGHPLFILLKWRSQLEARDALSSCETFEKKVYIWSTGRAYVETHCYYKTNCKRHLIARSLQSLNSINRLSIWITSDGQMCCNNKSSISCYESTLPIN